MSLSDVLKSMSLMPVLDLGEKEQFRLLDIRNQPLIRESSYTTHIIGTDEHRAWLKKLEENEDAHFYAVYAQDKLVGGVGLQEKDRETGEWSFYISQDAHGKGMGVGLAVHALDLFFDELSLKLITGEALSANAASVNFHLKLGFTKTNTANRKILPSQETVEVSCFNLDKTDWSAARTKLLS